VVVVDAEVGAAVLAVVGCVVVVVGEKVLAVVGCVVVVVGAAVLAVVGCVVVVVGAADVDDTTEVDGGAVVALVPHQATLGVRVHH